MMDLTNTLNAWAEWWSGFMWARLFDTTVAFVVVAALWLLLRKRTSPQLGYCLFLLVLLKFLLPIELTKPGWITYLSPQRVIHRAEHWTGSPWPMRLPVRADFYPGTTGAEVERISSIPESSADADGVNKAEPATPPAATPRAPLSAAAMLMLGWAGIVFALLFRFVRNQWKTYRLVRRAKPLQLETLPVDLDELKRLANVRRTVQLVPSPSVIVPVVSGIVRPNLLVPPDFFVSFTPNQVRWILLHELAHIRRADTLVATIQKILQIVFFFHPIIWLTNWIIDQQREYACDDVALAACGTPRTDCGQGFLSLAQRVSGLPTFTTSLLGPFNQNIQVRRRMMRILDTKRKLHVGFSAGSVVFLLAAALIVLPSVPAEENRIAENPTLALAETGTETSPAKSLHEAAAAGDIEQVKLLLSKGIDVNARDQRGCTALHCVAGWRPSSMLLNKYGRTPQREEYTDKMRKKLGIRELAQLLVGKGAQVNIQDNQGNTPLHYAAEHANKNVIELLIAKGADVNAKNQGGLTPLELTGWGQGHEEVRSLLVTSGANVPTIHVAAWLGDLPKVKAFIDQGVPVDAKARGTGIIADLTPILLI